MTAKYVIIPDVQATCFKRRIATQISISKINKTSNIVLVRFVNNKIERKDHIAYAKY